MEERNGGRGAWGFAAAAGLALAGVAAGQENYWFFEVVYSDKAGVIDSPDDFVTVNLWMEFSPEFYAFAGAELNNVTAADGAGLWSNPVTLVDDAPGTLNGTVEGDQVVGIIAAQLFFPFNNIWPDTSNPIRVWKAEWQTDDFTSRTISLSTDTLIAWLYTYDGLAIVTPVEEAYGSIVVIPSQGSVLMLSSVLVFGRRRR